MSKGTAANPTPPHDPANPGLEQMKQLLKYIQLPYAHEKSILALYRLGLAQEYQRGRRDGAKEIADRATAELEKGQKE